METLPFSFVGHNSCVTLLKQHRFVVKSSNRKIKALISQVRVRDASLSARLSIAGAGGMGDRILREFWEWFTQAHIKYEANHTWAKHQYSECLSSFWDLEDADPQILLNFVLLSCIFSFPPILLILILCSLSTRSWQFSYASVDSNFHVNDTSDYPSLLIF